jgi:hypothetical protein
VRSELLVITVVVNLASPIRRNAAIWSPDAKRDGDHDDDLRKTPRQEADDEEHDDLEAQRRQLRCSRGPPGPGAEPPQQRHAGDERGVGRQRTPERHDVGLDEADADQDEVSRHRLGEDVTMGEERVAVDEPGGHEHHQPGQQGQLDRRRHVATGGGLVQQLVGDRTHRTSPAAVRPRSAASLTGTPQS